MNCCRLRETIRSKIIIILKQARLWIETLSNPNGDFFLANPIQKMFLKIFEGRTYELRCNSGSKKNI